MLWKQDETLTGLVEVQLNCFHPRFKCFTVVSKSDERVFGVLIMTDVRYCVKFALLCALNSTRIWPNDWNVGNLFSTTCRSEWQVCCSQWFFNVCIKFLCFAFSAYIRLQCFSPSVLWRCWLGGRKGIHPVKTEWLDVGVVICLGRSADLHMAQQMPLPLTITISCSIKSRLILPSWFYLSGTGSPG